MKFLNLKNTCPKLTVALIFNYKRSTHARKRGAINQREKPKRNNKKTEFKGEIEGYHRRKITEIN